MSMIQFTFFFFGGGGGFSVGWQLLKKEGKNYIVPTRKIKCLCFSAVLPINAFLNGNAQHFLKQQKPGQLWLQEVSILRSAHKNKFRSSLIYNE